MMSRSASDPASPRGARRPLTREDVLGVGEVAELLGMPRSTVHDLARRGLLPARRVGRRWLFVRDRIEAAVTPLDDAAASRPVERNGHREAPRGRPAAARWPPSIARGHTPAGPAGAGGTLRS